MDRKRLLILDFNDLKTRESSNEEFPLFTKDWASPIKALVADKMYGPQELYTVSLFLEDGSWVLGERAIMEAKDILEQANIHNWIIVTPKWINEILGNPEPQKTLA